MVTVDQALAQGTRHHQAGQLAEAERIYRQVLAVEPENAEALVPLGEVLHGQGRRDEARACFAQATQMAPGNARAWRGMGLVLSESQEFDGALSAFESALAIGPDDARARNNLGNVLKQLRMFDEAEAQYRHAIRLDPQLSIAHGNLGALLSAQNRHREAVECLTTATRQDPQYAQAYSNLGSSLFGLGRWDDAVAAARRAIELTPNSSAAHCNLGSCLRVLGQLDRAVQSYRRAVELDPRNASQRSNLVYTLNYQPGHDPADVFAEHCQWGRVHADPLAAKSAPHAVDRSPQRRLRVGYVSGHFYAHAVNFFAEPILAAHDHGQFEVFCYANVEREDETTRRLRAHADQWRDIFQQTDEQAAELVRRDQIDILVDLSGHIGGNRLLVFAHKPAPLQVTYIGYQNTTGMAAMDYRLTDEWSDPPDVTDGFYTEKLVRLPRSFFCYLPSGDAPPEGPLPALELGYVTFGSFNDFSKITPQALATWAGVLKRVPGSRLVILASMAASLVKSLLRTFEGHGIAADRLTLADRRPRELYLEAVSQVDIALDPFPFNGHTTTCDALWQGVPVVTLAGRVYAERFGSSAHLNLGLQELIAGTPDEYADIAVRLAGDPDRLRGLRASLRERMRGSPLLDFAGFTRNLEAAYRKMWCDWCAAPTP